MRPDPIALLEAEVERTQADLAAYLRDQFIEDFTRAVTLHALADVAERTAQGRA